MATTTRATAKGRRGQTETKREIVEIETGEIEIVIETTEIEPGITGGIANERKEGMSEETEEETGTGSVTATETGREIEEVRRGNARRSHTLRSQSKRSVSTTTGNNVGLGLGPTLRFCCRSNYFLYFQDDERVADRGSGSAKELVQSINQRFGKVTTKELQHDICQIITKVLALNRARGKLTLSRK